MLQKVMFLETSPPSQKRYLAFIDLLLFRIFLKIQDFKTSSQQIFFAAQFCFCIFVGSSPSGRVIKVSRTSSQVPQRVHHLPLPKKPQSLRNEHWMSQKLLPSGNFLSNCQMSNCQKIVALTVRTKIFLTTGDGAPEAHASS